MSYDELTNGNYKLLIEPIIYVEVKFGTTDWKYVAMTPTQMALYDYQSTRAFYNVG